MLCSLTLSGAGQLGNFHHPEKSHWSHCLQLFSRTDTVKRHRQIINGPINITSKASEAREQIPSALRGGVPASSGCVDRSQARWTGGPDGRQRGLQPPSPAPPSSTTVWAPPGWVGSESDSLALSQEGWPLRPSGERAQGASGIWSGVWIRWLIGWVLKERSEVAVPKFILSLHQQGVRSGPVFAFASPAPSEQVNEPANE